MLHQILSTMRLKSLLPMSSTDESSPALNSFHPIIHSAATHLFVQLLGRLQVDGPSVEIIIFYSATVISTPMSGGTLAF